MSGSSNVIVPQSNPFALFGEWLLMAKATGMENHDAVNVSTLDLKGHPESRMVLMRRWNDRGFCFFTNYNSPKSKSLLANCWGHMCFFWQVGERQIRIQGVFEKTTALESDEYWNSRPRESQINALASDQSAPVAARGELEKRVQELTEQWIGKPIPRPSNWGGWRLVPWKFEFWLGHPFRLHDRLVYQRFSECPQTATLLSSTAGGQDAVTWNHFRIQP
ncbi:MAG: pyridoxamine 5'-phosphate oxidase [Bdellovibrionales bacterium]|nr:pyridoxamine 5'-phosphate oxidase [Bdellovibrionales bacterium]